MKPTRTDYIVTIFESIIDLIPTPNEVNVTMTLQEGVSRVNNLYKKGKAAEVKKALGSLFLQIDPAEIDVYLTAEKITQSSGNVEDPNINSSFAYLIFHFKKRIYFQDSSNR